MIIFFMFFFFLFLILHISFYHFFVNPNRVYKISSCPEMISPIWFLLQYGITLEQFYRQLIYRQLTLQDAHILRNGNFRWNRNHQMNMIELHIHLFYNNLFPFTQHFYVLLQQSFYSSSQNAKSIFRNKHNMIITFINYMRQFSVLHVTNLQTLRHSQTYITTVQDGGFLSQIKSKTEFAFKI